MKFNLPPVDAPRINPEFPHYPVDSKFTFVSACFPEDADEYEREAWAGWLPQARITEEGTCIVPASHLPLYNDLHGADVWVMADSVWLRASDSSIEDLIKIYESTGRSRVVRQFGDNFEGLILGDDTYNPLIINTRQPIKLKNMFELPKTPYLRTVRGKPPIDLLAQLPYDTMISTMVEYKGLVLEYVTSRAGRVKAYRVGSSPTSFNVVRVSEEALVEYGFVPVRGHKVWVIRWRFGVLDDIVIAEFPMPRMTIVFTNEDGEWSLNPDDLGTEHDGTWDATDSPDLGIFQVPSSYDDVDTWYAVGRAALERAT